MEIKDIPNTTLVSFVEMASVSNDWYIETKVDKPLGDLKKGSYTYFAENDILIAKITPCMENGKAALAKWLTNGIWMWSSEFHIFRADQNTIVPSFLFHFLNRKEIRQEAEKNMTGSSGHRRVPIAFYEHIAIPVPPLAKQQEIVKQIESYQAEIAKLENLMVQSASKKQAILNQYL